VRDQVDRTRELAENKRTSSRTVDTAMRLVERNRRIPATLLAGALASRLVIYVIPFLVLAVVATGLYSDISGVDPVATARDAGLPGLLATAVDDSSQASQGFQTATIIALAWASLWAANGLARLVRWIHAIIWSVPMTHPKKPWAQPLVVLLASMGVLAISRFGLEAGEWPVSVAVGEILLEVGLVALGWLSILRFLPRDPDAGSWTADLPGAFLVGFGFIGLKAAVVFYLAPRVTTLEERYGDVASAVLVLTWAYWIAFIIVFSVELNAALAGNRRERRLRAGATD
jgi:uncharacterized BrkB/YihY/UPF0761 family membrane protein